MGKIKIVLADDHILVRGGIKALLEDQDDIEVIDEASDGKEALELVKKHQPDILVVDIRMPEKNGIEVVDEINKSNQNIRTLVLSMHDSEEYVVKSIQAGADGYLLKGASKEEFLKALHTIAIGKKYFAGDLSSIILTNFVGNKPVNMSIVKPKELPFHLTKREKQILALVLELKNNKDIAEELNISRRTTEVHRFNLMKKLEAKNIKELTDKAEEYQLI